MIRTVFLSALVLVAAASAALAAARSPVEGVWSFKTGTFDNGCTLSGQLMVQPRRTDGSHVCQLKAREICPAIKDGGKSIVPALNIAADETCVLTEQKGRVTIKSKVTRADAQTYLPDNFSLMLKDASRMEGDFLSTEVLSKAVFYRGPEAIS